MFWRQELSQPVQLTKLLDKPDVTLFEIMEDEFLLQEVKCGNKRLIEFLVKEENLIALTKLCVTEPTSDENDQKKYKYCHLASEVISAGSETITTALANCSECFRILAAFVRPADQTTSKPLNPLLASFFSKVFTLLISKHEDQVLVFLQKEASFLDNLIQNLDTSALAESLYRLAFGGSMLMSTTNPNKTKRWLVEQSFISKLISQLDPSRSDETHQNVTFLLCELIRNLRLSQFNRDHALLRDEFLDPLVESFESVPILDELLDRTFASKNQLQYCDSIATSGFTIFLTLLQTVRDRQNPLRYIDDMGKYEAERPLRWQDDDFVRISFNKSYDNFEWQPDANRVAESCLLKRLPEFKRLLVQANSTNEPMLLPMGKLDQPLGPARLTLTQLLAQMLATGSKAIHDEVARLDIIYDLIGLMFKHKWNNFLHTNVTNCIICALYCVHEKTNDDCNVELEGDVATHSVSIVTSSLLRQVMETHHLLKLLLQRHSETKVEGNNVIPPYIGHIMRLAVAVNDALRNAPNSQAVKNIFETLPTNEREAWATFVDTYLLDYIRRNEPDQVGSMPSRDEGILTDHMEDFTGTVSRFSKGFASADKAALSGSDGQDLNKSLSQLTAADFLKDDPQPMDEDAFEAICAVNMPPDRNTKDMFGHDDEDIWHEKEITFSDDIKEKPAPISQTKRDDVRALDTNRAAVFKNRTSSSDEEEEMDVTRDGEPMLWQSSGSSNKEGQSENWASFDEEWPALNSSSSKSENVSNDSGGWAQFEQSHGRQQNEQFTSKAPMQEDWPVQDNLQKTSNERGGVYLSDTKIHPGPT